MVETIYCVHCGAVAKHPVSKMIDGRLLHFCCGGCLQVYEMMHEEGLSSDQNNREAQAHPQPGPVQSAGKKSHATLSIGGMSCANCVATVGQSLRKLPGVLNVHVDLVTEKAEIEMTPGKVTASDLRRAVERAGYTVESLAGL
jgi:P-type Cu2+ transporter